MRTVHRQRGRCRERGDRDVTRRDEHDRPTGQRRDRRRQQCQREEDARRRRDAFAAPAPQEEDRPHVPEDRRDAIRDRPPLAVRPVRRQQEHGQRALGGVEQKDRKRRREAQRPDRRWWRPGFPNPDARRSTPPKKRPARYANGQRPGDVRDQDRDARIHLGCGLPPTAHDDAQRVAGPSPRGAKAVVQVPHVVVLDEVRMIAEDGDRRAARPRPAWRTSSRTSCPAACGGWRRATSASSVALTCGGRYALLPLGSDFEHDVERLRDAAGPSAPR